ncbi:MAG: DUF4124 domain-containing protein [Thermodesulfobacteriota bacterium]|nr:DUF4124 domain-containing protein [Thermodesulfobacteriota bacterium]
MNLIKLFICLIIIFFSTAVSAEFYKYVDENGNTHFTDDFNKVPQDQRAGLKGYEEPGSDNDTDNVVKNAIKQNAGQDENKNQEDLEKFHDRLNNTRLQLVKEHEEIKKEREQIAEDRKNANNRRDVWKINEKIKKLNQQQEELKKKFEAFETEKKEYNQRLEEAEAKKK